MPFEPCHTPRWPYFLQSGGLYIVVWHWEMLCMFLHSSNPRKSQIAYFWLVLNTLKVQFKVQLLSLCNCYSICDLCCKLKCAFSDVQEQEYLRADRNMNIYQAVYGLSEDHLNALCVYMESVGMHLCGSRDGRSLAWDPGCFPELDSTQLSDNKKPSI